MNDLDKILLPMNLGFFEGEKTEKASPRKKKKAREEGQVAKSGEVAIASMILAIFAALKLFAGYMYNGILSVYQMSFSMLNNYDEYFEAGSFSKIMSEFLIRTLLIALPIMLVAVVVAFVANFIQVGWKPTSKPLVPDFSRLNPINGIKRLFSVKSLLELFKSLAKLTVIIFVIYYSFINKASKLGSLVDMELGQGAAYIADSIVNIGISVGAAYLLIAAMDYGYARYKFAKDLRMTKQEVREEYKETEGNPQTKAAARRAMNRMARGGMLAWVSQADVVIVDRGSFAAAVKYDAENSEAVPVVTVKGAELFAERIEKIAEENGVVVIENKNLAQTLYNTVDSGEEIREGQYDSVAEALALAFADKK